MSSNNATSSVGRFETDAGARLEALHAEHSRAVLGLCRMLLRDPTEAEDAHQATFLAAFRSLAKGTVPREPGAWLAAIARNECWSRVRARMRDPLPIAEPEGAADPADPLALAIRNENVGVFWAAFAELPKPQQQAFLLREFRGLSYEDLAVALGVSNSAVESLLFRARRGLQTAMATIATLPLGLRDLIARLGAGTATTGVAAKAVTATVGLGLFAAGSAGLEAHHPARHRVAAPVAAVRSQRAPAAAAAPALVRTAAARLRPVHAAGHRTAIVWIAPAAASTKTGSEDSAAQASQVEDAQPAAQPEQSDQSQQSGENAQPEQQSASESTVRQEAVTPETEHPDGTSGEASSSDRGSGYGSGDSHEAG